MKEQLGVSVSRRTLQCRVRHFIPTLVMTNELQIKNSLKTYKKTKKTFAPRMISMSATDTLFMVVVTSVALLRFPRSTIKNVICACLLRGTTDDI